MARLRVAAAFLLAGVAVAALVPRFTLENLIDRSQIIVEGRITGSRTAWDPAHKYIWTHYDVQVLDAIRGGSSQVIVSEPGGNLDGENQGFSGALPYAAGEHVILFLYRTPIGYWRTAGGGQGKFVEGKDGRMTASIQGLEFVSSTGTSKQPAGTPLSSVDHLETAKFKSIVRTMARRRPAPKEVR